MNTHSSSWNFMQTAYFSPNETCYNNELWPDLLIYAMNQLEAKKHTQTENETE